jgi:hypothetical protein
MVYVLGAAVTLPLVLLDVEMPVRALIGSTTAMCLLLAARHLYLAVETDNETK